MCKINRFHRIETILNNIVKEEPILEEACKDFLIRMKGNSVIDTTFPVYQQIIYKIYGPDYPANRINVQEIKSLIDSISNSTIYDLLNQALKEKISYDVDVAERTTYTSINANEARRKANNELQENLNSINNKNPK